MNTPPREQGGFLEQLQLKLDPVSRLLAPQGPSGPAASRSGSSSERLTACLVGQSSGPTDWLPAAFRGNDRCVYYTNFQARFQGHEAFTSYPPVALKQRSLGGVDGIDFQKTSTRPVPSGATVTGSGGKTTARWKGRGKREKWVKAKVFT